MRHRVYGKKLGRTKNERTALFKTLVQSLFLTGTITTSRTKVFAIKGLVDKIINLAKTKDTRNLLQAYLSKDLQERLVKEIAPKFTDRISGYTSVLRVGTREGDRTTMVKMSIIGMEQLKPIEKKVVEKKVETKKEIKAKEAAPKKEIKEKIASKKTAPKIKSASKK